MKFDRDTDAVPETKPDEATPEVEAAAPEPIDEATPEPAEEPAAEKPAEEPNAESPGEESPGEEPRAAEPAAEEPRAAEPAAEESPAEEPRAAEPAAERPPAALVQTPAAAPTGPQAGVRPGKSTKAKVLLAAALVLVIGMAVGGYLWFNRGVPEGVAFRVNGVNVTEQELEEQVQTLSALYGVQAPTEEPRLDTFRRDVAKSTAFAMVIDNAAAERKIVIADEQVADFLAKYVAAQYGAGQAGRDAYVKDLADKGTSEPKVLQEIKRQMTLKQLFNQVTADVTATDEDVRQAFDQRRGEFDTPERREIHNIVVKTKQEADALAAELRAGGNLEALAAQRSLDGSTKNSGGNLGLVTLTELQKSYADVAFGTPTGQVFGPVETQQKTQGTVWNVGRAVRSEPGAPADFDKVKDSIRQLVLTEHADEKWRAFMLEQVKDADVDYSDKYRPADPNGLPAPNGGPTGQAAPSEPPN